MQTELALKEKCPTSLVLRFACKALSKASACHFPFTQVQLNSVFTEFLLRVFCNDIVNLHDVLAGIFYEVFAHIFFNVIFSVERTGCGEYEL